MIIYVRNNSSQIEHDRNIDIRLFPFINLVKRIQKSQLQLVSINFLQTTKLIN